MSLEYQKSYIHRPETCPAVGYQDVVVGVPVEIKPFADIGKIKAECIGKPIIARGTTTCEGKPREVCKFTVSQKIRIEVPVIFGAKTEVGQARIDCRYHGYPCDREEEGTERGENEGKHGCGGLLG